jgi:serine/threonine protein phosphatase 1
MKQRFALFGDVHGDSTLLRRALAYGNDRASRIIGLGDYVNRGRHTSDVLDLMVEANRNANAKYVFLRGNHEVELLRFIETGDLSRFAAFGGLETIASYVDPALGNVVAEFQRAFPSSHRTLLEDMPNYFETEDYLFSHVGFDPENPTNRDQDSMVMGSFHDLFTYEGEWPRRFVVSGHYPQRSGIPFQSQHYFSIDTGCGTFPDGRLTLLLLPSKTITQFDHADG